MTVIANIFIILLISVGVLFTVVTVIGVLRLPDVYTRAHAASKSATLGVMSVLTGVFFYFWLNEGIISIQLILGVIFLFFTSPIGGHLMSRAAYVSGVKPSKLTVRNDLEGVLKQRKPDPTEK